MLRRLSLILCLAVIILSVRSTAATYTQHSVGVIRPDTDWSHVVSISDTGTALVDSWSSNSSSGVFLWGMSSGQTTITRPGVFDTAYGMSSAGAIAGSRCNEVTSCALPVLRSADGQCIDLPLLPHYTYGWAFAVNDAGMAIGILGDSTAVLWRGAAEPQILSETAVSEMNMNCSGQVIWNATDTPGSGTVSAYLRSTTGTVTQLAPLPGTNECRAYGINDLGVIVGSSGNHAVLWTTPGAPIDLGLSTGPFGAEAMDINNAGQVVGHIGGTAVVWSAAGDPTYLVDCNSGTPSKATCISDTGWIGGLHGQFGTVWQPVPEPSSLLALAALLGPVAGLAIRRRR